MPPSTLWFIDPDYPILLNRWNDQADVVAYHSGTGDAHQLTQEGALILELLQEENGKLSAENITERFRTKLNQPDLEFDTNDVINSFLIPFLELELVDTATAAETAL